MALLKCPVINHGHSLFFFLMRPHHFEFLDMLDWHQRHLIKLCRGLCCRFGNTLGDPTPTCDQGGRGQNKYRWT